MTTADTVAVLGAGGTMGRPMARNLARAGLTVRAWNRSREKAEPLADDGIEVFDDVADAAAGATVLVTMLSDAPAVLDAVGGDGGPLPRLGDAAVWLQMSTIGLDGTARCAELAERHGVAFADAPVLGTRQPAEEGQLIVLASGPEEVRERLSPLFDAVGQRTLWVGEAGRGSRLKLAVNSWLLSVVEGAAETLALADGLGLDPALVLEAVGGGTLDMPYLRTKGRAMIEREFGDPAFKLGLAAKDAGLVEDAAREAGLDLPLIAAIRGRMEEGARERGDQDMAATFLTSAR
jgi:3-hydroxyisobutyrate dehydrogenase